MSEIAVAPSAERIEKDIVKWQDLERDIPCPTQFPNQGNWGSTTLGKVAFDEVSKNCNNCLEVSYLGDLVKAAEAELLQIPKW